MSPLRHSLTSLMKKSTFGLPIPTLTIDNGTPLNRPVIVVNPRSEDSLNGFGVVSRYDAMLSAREAEPTVIYMRNFRISTQRGTNWYEGVHTMRLATSPERSPRW